MYEKLKELVDIPNECLGVEYKSWLDVSDVVDKAKIARHLAALTNFGGGYIVFGFQDDMQPCSQSNPYPFNRDDITSIISKYLEPSFQVDVVDVKSTMGVECKIIIVPSHGKVPVCSIAGGPEKNGRPQGISAATYYCRKAGPQSAPILKASEWSDIIRRCALNERSSILAALGAALGAPASPERGPEVFKSLDQWADAAENKFLQQIGLSSRPADLNKHQIFSYFIATADNQMITPKQFQNDLSNINFEVEKEIKTGWPLFYVFRGLRPDAIWITDPTSGGAEDFLESSQLLETRSFGNDLWRAAPDGRLAAVREFWEDTLPEYPRDSLSPNILGRTLSELVEHAFALGSRFDNPTTVYFRCKWRGIAGRHLHSDRGIPFFGSSCAVANEVVTSTESPFSQLQNNSHKIVAQLGGKLIRAFNSHLFTEDWVKSARPAWRNI